MADESLADLERSGIYQIQNTKTGKRYIGSAVRIRNRWAVHRHGLVRGVHHSRHLQRAWDKHGPEAFEFTVLEFCDKEDLICREQHWLDVGRPEFNSAKVAGSNLGVKHSAETRRKRSLLNIGNQFCAGREVSARCKQAVAEANRRRKGQKRSPEAVSKTAEAHRGMKRSAETRARIADAKRGKKLGSKSEETRRKLSEALRGKPKPPITEEHRRNLSLAQKKRWAKARAKQPA